MKKLSIFFTLAMLICLLAACGSASPSDAPVSSKPAESSQSAAESTQTDILYAVFSAEDVKEYPIEYTGAQKTAEELANELSELTGLENVYMDQIGAFGAVDRDPGERVISLAYYALININEYDRELVQQHNAYWVNINKLPDLIFDHNEMVEKARAIMKQKASRAPIGFNLLPELFTLTQLQSLYEAIYGEPMDKRNFRKRIAEMGFIEKTDKIDKTGSRRGASLYKFNDKAYQKDPKFKL